MARTSYVSGDIRSRLIVMVMVVVMVVVVVVVVVMVVVVLASFFFMCFSGSEDGLSSSLADLAHPRLIVIRHVRTSRLGGRLAKRTRLVIHTADYRHPLESVTSVRVRVGVGVGDGERQCVCVCVCGVCERTLGRLFVEVFIVDHIGCPLDTPGLSFLVLFLFIVFRGQVHVYCLRPRPILHFHQRMHSRPCPSHFRSHSNRSRMPTHQTHLHWQISR